MSKGWKPPTVGDLVWCWFPEIPSKSPGPKPRPALVIDVEVRDDGASVRVVYGTSQRVDRLKTGEFSIRKAGGADAYALAGLAYDTKFDFKVILDLPWTEEFFRVAPRAAYGQTPKLGTLHPSLLRAVEAAYRAARTR